MTRDVLQELFHDKASVGEDSDSESSSEVARSHKY